MKTDALFSKCRKYRFALWRKWDESKTSAMIIGLNPSTADEQEDDPTIRRCIDFAKSWGYGGLCMANLFAFRATDPHDMFNASEPIGAKNDEWLVRLAKENGIVVAAWGNNGSFLGRSKEVINLIPNLHYLKNNKTGEPAHPLYLKATLQPVPMDKKTKVTSVQKMNILVWNTEWAKPNSQKEAEILRIFDELQPDIACITEGYIQTWESKGFCISSEEDYGYKIEKGKRKAILISQKEWESKDEIGSEHLPPGRFCCGRSYNLDIGGVCIPWKDAHVKTGLKNKAPWEDHQIYLDHLKELIYSKTNSSIVMGDFNQRIPRKYTPVDVHNKLLDTFRDNYTIETSGIIKEIGKQSIDHIATSKNIQLSNLRGISNYVNGIRVSDHFGIFCHLTLNN